MKSRQAPEFHDGSALTTHTQRLRRRVSVDLLGRPHDVGDEHGPCHGPDTPNTRRHPRRHILHLEIDVGEQLLSRPAGPRANDGRTGLHDVGGHEAGHTGGGDDDVGAAYYLRKTLYARVHHRDRRVAPWPLTRQQEGERATHRDATANDDDVLAFHLDAMSGEKFHNANLPKLTG